LIGLVSIELRDCSVVVSVCLCLDLLLLWKSRVGMCRLNNVSVCVLDVCSLGLRIELFDSEW